MIKLSKVTAVLDNWTLFWSSRLFSTISGLERILKMLTKGLHSEGCPPHPQTPSLITFFSGFGKELIFLHHNIRPPPLSTLSVRPWLNIVSFIVNSRSIWKFLQPEWLNPKWSGLHLSQEKPVTPGRQKQAPDRHCNCYHHHLRYIRIIIIIIIIINESSSLP